MSLPIAPPRRRSWLLVVASVVLGIGAVGVGAAIVVSGGPEAALVGFGLASAPVPFLVAVYLWLDRYEPEPRRYLVAALGWGAVMATSLALVFTALGMQLTGVPPDLAGVVWAPLTEELAKGLFIVVVLVLRRHEIDGVLDGIVYAGMVGIGFAFTENVLYYMDTYVTTEERGGPGLSAATGLFILRGVISPFAHPLFTAGVGIGVGVALAARGRSVRRLAPLLGYAVAVLLHGAWNGSVILGGPGGFFLTYTGAMLPALALLLGLGLWVRRREGRVLAQALHDCSLRGWLHPAEVPWIASLPHRSAARAFAHRLRGPAGARAVSEYQQAATELGFLHDRVMRGRPPKDAARRAREILARMGAWRPYVVLPPPLPVLPRHLRPRHPV
ncbi:MAG: PrsW family intramembrane metalloprotease [Actinomycetota bacterium]|nr:PrsW family intramembrane metalloprotease [Actinomycetota bacterium]